MRIAVALLGAVSPTPAAWRAAKHGSRTEIISYLYNIIHARRLPIERRNREEIKRANCNALTHPSMTPTFAACTISRSSSILNGVDRQSAENNNWRTWGTAEGLAEEMGHFSWNFIYLANCSSYLKAVSSFIIIAIKFERIDWLVLRTKKDTMLANDKQSNRFRYLALAKREFFIFFPSLGELWPDITSLRYATNWFYLLIGAAWSRKSLVKYASLTYPRSSSPRREKRHRGTGGYSGVWYIKWRKKLKGSYYYKIGDSRNEVTFLSEPVVGRTCINLPRAVAVPDPPSTPSLRK